MGRPKGSTKKKILAAVDKALAEEEAPAPPAAGADEFITAYPNGKVTVWERVRDKADSLVGTFEADGDVQARVAETVGGGDYVWKLRLPTGLWASREKDGINGQGKFSINERAFPKKANTLIPVAAPPAAASDTGFNLQALFMAQMQQTTALLTALVNRPQLDPLSMLGALKNIMPPPAPPSNPLENIATAMDLMKNAQDLAGSRGGGGGGGGKMQDRIFGLLEAVAPTVAGRLLAPQAQGAQVAPAQAPRQPAPALAAVPAAKIETPPVAANPAEEGDDVGLKQMLEFHMIAPYIPGLADLAQRGRDPVTYADVFLDEAEKKNVTPDQIGEFFGNKELVAQLSAKFPEVAANAKWFEEFRSAVYDALTAPPEGDTLTGDAAPPGAPAPPENSDS